MNKQPYVFWVSANNQGRINHPGGLIPT